MRRSQDRGDAVEDRDREREHVRRRLLCHDLDSDAEFFGDDACGPKFFTTSPHTLIMVARTLGTAIVLIPGHLYAHRAYNQTNIQSVHVYTSRVAI